MNVIKFDQNYLDLLFDRETYYRNLSKHLNVVFSQYIYKIKLKGSFYNVYELLALLKLYNYTKGKVKKDE